ncbi:MAG TPA: DUF2142 domain-containing protein [Candidatus Acidoferrales bacterium]|jgi:hypothetical protein|nr:DUF2142 domain-containing protein [Candidatus Acidoferrales bacterium]
MANTTLKPTPAPFFELHEKKIVLLLCVLAAVHVFIFSAGFPFFNNVDEGMHFDLVLRYARGDVPRQIELISTNAGAYLGLMSSHEFYEAADAFPGKQYPAPLWTLPPETVPRLWTARSEIWQTEYNYEISQPPLYYALSGLWWHMGGWFGLHGGRLAYWLRFFNIVLVSSLVWLAYATARLIFPNDSSSESPSAPDSVFLRLAVPACLAFMPQSAFYSIGNDTLSAICFGIAFLLIVLWFRTDTPSAGLGIATGLAFAATCLSKMTNIPILAVATLVVLFKARRDIQAGKSRETALSLAGFLICAELPSLAWIAWCRAHFGDITGSAPKAHFLGWTIKPFAQWWHHPIFSPSGLWTYLSGELGTFWQGEIWWHGPRLCLPGTDYIFTLVSFVLLAAALPSIVSVRCPRFSVFRSGGNNCENAADHRPNLTLTQRKALQLALACFLAELAFFGLMSIIYDFHNCPNPSRDHPYFEAGRMMFGALIPFILLFVYGLNCVLSRVGTIIKFVTLIAMVTAMLALEIATDRPAFASPYNWYHLPQKELAT